MKVSGDFFRKLVLKALLPVCIISIIFYGGCDKEEPLPRTHPKIRTLEVADISAEGARYSGRIERQGSEEIIEWGFVWDTNQNPKIETAEYHSEKYSTGQETIHRDVLSTLVTGNTYYVRLFARTASFVIYGNEVVFKSMGSGGAEITGFSPIEGSISDTVRISGRNFSSLKSGNLIRFDTAAVSPFAASDSLLLVSVPANLNKSKSKVSVIVAGKTAISEQFFTLIGPKVSNYSPKTGTIGDTITIAGENFSSEPINKVAFNTWHGQVVWHSENELKVIVPENLTGTTPIKVTVEVGTNKIVVGEPFGITTPAISSVFPITARIGDTLTINGQNFSWNKGANKVTLESAPCQIVQASKSELRVIIPDHQPSDNYILTTPRDPSNLKLSIALKTSEDYREFTYLAPMYIAFSPEKGMPLDTVVLQGKNFSAFRDEWRMEVSGIAVEILNVTDNELSFVVPAEVSFNNVYFTASTIHYFWSWTYELQIPKILAVNPSQVTVGDEIEISGKYFNPSTQLNSLWLNQQPTQILFSDKSRIRAKIPSDISSQDGSINIKVQTSEHPEQWGETDNLLLLRKPEITMVSPVAVSFDEEVIIIGNYFNPKAENNFIYFNSSPAEVISASANQINARVPRELITTNGVIDITVDVGGENSLVRDTKAAMLVLKGPEIHAITPTILTNLNGQVTISGSGFNPVPTFNQIVFQGLSAQILSATTSQIICQINFFEKYDQEEYVHITEPIELKCGGYAVSSSQSLEVLQNKPWKKLSEFPGIQREYYVAFSAEGDGYIVGGINPLLGLYFNEVWQFSPSSNSWSQKANFPGGARHMAKVFKIGEEVYVGGGRGKNETYSDFWRYDHASDSWTKIADFPGGPRWYPIVFGLGDKGYLGSGYSANTNEAFIDLWEYNPSNNEWVRKNDITPFEEFEGSNSAASAILNGTAYVQTMSYKTDPSIHVFRIFKYDHLMDIWIKVIDIQTGQTSLATVIDNKWYMQYPYDYSESVLNIFDPLGIEIWREKSSIKKLRRGAAFAVGGKGYFLSEGYYESGQEFWELDPSKLE